MEPSLGETSRGRGGGGVSDSTPAAARRAPHAANAGSKRNAIAACANVRRACAKRLGSNPPGTTKRSLGATEAQQ